jgi:hypothetical protein
VTDEDWQLATLVWDCSCEVRDDIVQEAKRDAQNAREIADQATVDLAVRTEEAKSDASVALLRIARVIVRHVGTEPGGMSKAAAYKKVAHRDRPKYEKALDFALSRGWLIEGDEHLNVGRVGE